MIKVRLNDTIIAPSTPQGIGAVAILRITGPEAISTVEKFFFTRSGYPKLLADKPANTTHFGVIRSPYSNEPVDEVLIAIYKGPNSFTGEDVVEINTHGSPYIVGEFLKLFLLHGIRLAEPGEFTMRAYLNKKMDLAQAEAVGDLISAQSEAAHRLAMKQMRGGFSKEINQLRTELIHFCSLIELELDFGEEDVEFASRTDLQELLERLMSYCKKLADSFRLGNAIKNGIPVAIVGKPNAGKSSLLNAMLQEERAIVSDIAGTTRDTIEEFLHLGGLTFRLIDTAGIRVTTDQIEALGVARAMEKLQLARIVLFLFDLTLHTRESLIEELEGFEFPEDAEVILVGTKLDKVHENMEWTGLPFHMISMSSFTGEGLELIYKSLLENASITEAEANDVVVSNIRHATALIETLSCLERALEGLNLGQTGDLLAMDLRQSLYHLGTITGEISVDDLLENIFSKFCIGK